MENVGIYRFAQSSNLLDETKSCINKSFAAAQAASLKNRLLYYNDLFRSLMADVLHPVTSVRGSWPTYTNSFASSAADSFNEI